MFLLFVLMISSIVTVFRLMVVLKNQVDVLFSWRGKGHLEFSGKASEADGLKSCWYAFSHQIGIFLWWEHFSLRNRWEKKWIVCLQRIYINSNRHKNRTSLPSIELPHWHQNLLQSWSYLQCIYYRLLYLCRLKWNPNPSSTRGLIPPSKQL